ncbi:PKD domain-containing protein [Arthrobacter sp. M4]|uniref:PKD domain-containing protein n=1 Tax=Arthrobacter sp. M4 TaxID=218160 RepID=UPI0027DFA149|nr:PKD domain-containing protein [Arthrobacter sp. M4]
MRSYQRRYVSELLAFCLAIAGLAGLASPAQAAADYGTQSISYSGVVNPPTSDKPQSKLWWNDGSWWADMWTTGSGWSIYRLDRPTKTWVDTGVRNDSRSNTLADALWDGSRLYIASHAVTITGDGTPKPSVAGQPAKLYRYSYSAGIYSLDAGFPTTINNNSSESMTIDKDSTGAIWATWTQVSGNSTSGYTNTVYVNNSAPGGTSWSTPFVLPVPDPTPAPDDISAIVAYRNNKMGVMWSDHLTGTMWWATRTDGTAPTAASSWNVQPAVKAKGQADDHMNVKSLQADTSGRVFAAIKTSFNDFSSDPTLPELQLLVFRPGTGSFTKSTIATAGDCVTRPQILLDTQNNLVHAFHTAPSTSVSGCAFSGVAGSIYEKTASMDNPVFGSGRGTPVIQDGSSANLNDVTTTKQGVDATTGIVVMASNNVTKRYWYSDRSLGTPPPPPPPAAPIASFTASPTTGTAPLTVNFTDTSTGAPTSWSWTFGDGGTSAAQNPSHVYNNAGSYPVALAVTNSSGSSSSSGTITATAPSPGPTGSVSAVGSATVYSATATTALTLPAPAGITAGDLLIAAFTTDLNPTPTAPSGWTPIVNALSINSSSSSGARVSVYYHVVASGDPGSFTWTLSSAVKWGGGITAYRGVNQSSPLDATVTTSVDTTYSATSITLPGITTASNGAMLIGGLGFDAASPGTTPPSGWTEQWEAAGGQVAEEADVPQPTAGTSSSATWSFAVAKAVGAWRTALKPA